MTEGGILNVVTREVSIEALPLEIPDVMELSIEGMVLGDSRTVADLAVPEGVTVLDDPETVLLSVAVTRVILVEAEPEEDEELERARSSKRARKARVPKAPSRAARARTRATPSPAGWSWSCFPTRPPLFERDLPAPVS